MSRINIVTQETANTDQKELLDAIQGKLGTVPNFLAILAHSSGKEFLVLEGTFSDEAGDFGPDLHLRNLVGTSQTPYTEDGCTILVKLWQFQDGDDEMIKTDTLATPFAQGMVGGLSVFPLHQFHTESAALVRWQPGTYFTQHTHFGGE